jgi:hypothetical protein
MKQITEIYANDQIILFQHNQIPKRILTKTPLNFLKQVFLPIGYPSSVSSDYLSYQVLFYNIRCLILFKLFVVVYVERLLLVQH